MKKLVLLLACCALAVTNVRAQDDDNEEGFKTVWESEFENRATELSVVNADGSIIIGSDQNEATGLDQGGKLVWSGRYKDITGHFGLNNCNFQYACFDANALFLFDKKLGKDKMAVIDMKTGKSLWTSEEYQNVTDDNTEYIAELDAFLISLKSSLVMLDARTGQKRWETDKFRGSIGQYLFLPATKEIVMVNYKPTGLAALFSGFKNQMVRINALNGEIKWEATFRGLVEREVITRKPLVKLFRRDDKIFLQLDGLQVYDFETGKEIWSAVYETDEAMRSSWWNRGPHGGKIVKGGIYGAISNPIFTDDAVYLVLGGDKLKQKYIEKHDLKTGKVLWTSEKIKNALAMPSIILEDGHILAQIGGLINRQSIERVTQRNSTGTTEITYYNNYWDFMGSYGILCLDAEKGSTAWRSEKFDKRITNLITGEGMVFAGSGDEFYGFNIRTGEMKINVDHSKRKVGKSMWAFDNGDNVALVCDNGMSAYSKKDGSLIYNTDKFRGVTNYHMVGNNFFLRKEKSSSNTLCAIDLKTGNTKGIIKSKGKGGGSVYGDGFDITADGEYIFAFKGKRVQKLKVNK